jgi:hypothetical protein
MKLNIEIRTNNPEEMPSLVRTFASDIEQSILSYSETDTTDSMHQAWCVALAGGKVGVVVDGDLVGNYKLED